MLLLPAAETAYHSQFAAATYYRNCCCCCPLQPLGGLINGIEGSLLTPTLIATDVLATAAFTAAAFGAGRCLRLTRLQVTGGGVNKHMLVLACCPPQEPLVKSWREVKGE